RRVELWNTQRALFNFRPDGRSIMVAQIDRESIRVACCPIEDAELKSAMWLREFRNPVPWSVLCNLACVADGRFVIQEYRWDSSEGRGVNRYLVCSLENGEPLSTIEGSEIVSQPVASPNGRL